MSQPGFGPQGPQDSQNIVNPPGSGTQIAPQWPGSRPGPGAQNGPRGPQSQPGFGPQDSLGPNQVGSWQRFQMQNADDSAPGQRNFPPPGWPMSQPGFSFTGRPRDDYATDAAPPWPGNAPQGGNPVPPWDQPPTRSQPNAAPWGPPPQSQTQQQNSPWGPPPQPQVQQQNSPWGPPPQGAPMPQPAPPRKKSRLGLISVIILIVIVVIGSVSGLLFLRSQGGLHPGATGTAQATGTHGTSGVTQVPTSTASPTPTGNNTLHPIGTPVQAGTDWIVTVTSVKETTASLFVPNPGNTYLEINLSLKNISGTSLTLVSYLFFTLSDGKHETARDTNIHRPPDGNVNSNQTLDAQIAFEVPKSQHTFIFNFAYGLAHKTNDTVSWQFNV